MLKIILRIGIGTVGIDSDNLTPLVAYFSAVSRVVSSDPST